MGSNRVEHCRQKYSRQRASLQRIGTKSAKRKLRKISGKERRFKKDTNHCIANDIISKAKGTARAIALEDLTNIRSRVTVRHQQRDKHSKWAFAELRNFLTYGAKQEGIPLKVVNPEYTSQQCPKCPCVDERNRKTRDQFECIKCDYKEMADYVAATNIAARAAVNQPHGSVSFYDSYKPRCFSAR